MTGMSGVNASLLPVDYKVSFSSSFMAPINWASATDSLQFYDRSESTSSTNAGLGDVVVVPLTVGIHLSENKIPQSAA